MCAVSLFPNGNNDGVNKAVISHAHFILKHDPEKADLAAVFNQGPTGDGRRNGVAA